jgi:hypothetical protein
LSIEFDGMGRGFSRNGEYMEISPSDDKYRKLKFDLKLKISTQTGYPYFIVSYKETENLEPGLNLTIVDGIIGKVLAWKRLSHNNPTTNRNYTIVQKSKKRILSNSLHIYSLTFLKLQKYHLG